jgi:DNA-binding MarR family transcriptional regulator
MSTPGRNANLSALAEVDRLIHEPARLAVMALLYVVESADFIFLMNQTGLTWGNLSAHMSKLEEAGYIEVVKSFKGKRPNTMMRLTQAGRVAFQAYRQQMKRVLDGLPE